MDVVYPHKGYPFTRDSRKAAPNMVAHGITFEQACDVFFDPFYWMGLVEESEELWDIIGYSTLVGRDRPLFVVAAEKRGEDAWRIISARYAPPPERRRYEEDNVPSGDRPTTMISIRMPVDVVEKLEEIAPAKGMSGYQALIKYYVGKGLREDLDLFLQVRSHAETLDTLGKIFQDMTPEQLVELRKRAEEIKHATELKSRNTDKLSPVSEKEQEQSPAQCQSSRLRLRVSTACRIPEALEGSDMTSNELYQKAYRAHYKEHDAEKALAVLQPHCGADSFGFAL